MAYEGIIFDFDGTLANTLSGIAGCANACAAALGFPGAEQDEYRYLIGNGLTWLAEKLLKTDDPGVLQRFIASFNERLPAWQEKTTTLYDGVVPCLQALEKRGIQTAVFSNKPDHLLKPLAAQLLPGHPFEYVLGQTDDMPRKPDPAGALLICEKLGLAPGQMLYVGDTATDMETGTAAGLTTIGVLWGFRTARELVEAGAHALVAHPRELLPMLHGVHRMDLLATERLVIRPTQMNDLPAIEDFWDEPEANVLDHGNKAPGTWTRRNRRILRKGLRKGPSRAMWTLLLPPDLTVMGYIRLRQTHFLSRRGTIAVRLGQAFWGKGYAPEALKHLCRHMTSARKLRAIELEVLADNQRGLRAYEKAGFFLLKKFHRDDRQWCRLQWSGST